MLFCATTLVAQNFNVSPQLRKHVDYLCSDSLMGRKAGSDGEREAAGYIWRYMKDAGVEMLTDENGQDFRISADSGEISSRNVVGAVSGFDPVLREEYIVVGAHYDGLGTNSLTVNGQKIVQIYQGADGNASGVAMLLELASLVAANSFLFPRSIIFVAYGAGECALAGSWYFANRAFSEMESVKAAVNLDMLGRGDKKDAFTLFSQMRSNDLSRIMENTAEESVVKVPLPASGSIATSDHLPFYEKNIPVCFFTTGMSGDYHSVRDTRDKLDFDNMEYEVNYIFYFLKQLSAEREINRIGTSNVAPGDERIYEVRELDRRPQFFHSDESHFLNSWVYKYLKYPKRAVANGIQGRVIVSFVIEKDGSVTDVRVEKSVDEDLDAEAVKVVSISPKWIAGVRNGQKVRTRLSVPVEFRLTR